MPNKQGTKDLNLLIRKAITEQDLTAELVKDYFERVFGGTAHSGHLSNFLAGNKTAEISFLIGVYAALHCSKLEKDLSAIDLQKSFVQTDRNELKKWLVYWLEAILEQDMGRSRKGGSPFVYEPSYLEKWFEAIRELKADFGERKISKSALPTLDCFPDAFTPLTVITGTGLAIPPSRISDLFRANASLTDLFFLNELKLPKDTRIVSDRFVIDMNPSDRVRHFGDRHLLVIGGPKVNAVAREFGKYGIFRFQLPDEETLFQDLYDELRSEDQKNDLFPYPGCLEMFYELLNEPRLMPDDPKFKKLVRDEGQRTKVHEKAIELIQKLGDPKSFKYRDIIKTFVPTHLIDPVCGRLFSAKAPYKEKDLTMITLAPNFYDRVSETASYTSNNYRFVSVIIAGVDRLGTAAGLRALAQPEDFVDYPLGGFLEADEGIGLDFERYSRGQCSWSDTLTQPYTIEAFIGKVRKFKEAEEPTNKNPALHLISDEEGLDVKGLDNYLSFLEKFQTQT
jgi:hypothetical protein